MNVFTYIIFISLALVTTLLDTSFFSYLEIYYATILTSLAFLISFSILNLKKGAVIYAAFLTLFFAIFSSLPVWLLICLFFGLPLIIFAVRFRLAIDRSILILILTFIVANLLFQLSLAIASLDFSKYAFISVVSFTVINTLAGLAIYYITKTIINILSRFLNKF